MLSQVLPDYSFVCVKGTIEYVGGMKTVVKDGKPNTFNQNNGIVVVYDERGWPWVFPAGKLTDDVMHALQPFNLEGGAYVPHSNDGGTFIRDLFPEHYQQ